MLHVRVDTRVLDEAVVTLRGTLTAHTAGQLRAALSTLLNRGRVTIIRLDLRGLDVLDAAGIATVVVAHRICEQVGVRLDTLHPEVRAVGSVTGGAPGPAGGRHGAAAVSGTMTTVGLAHTSSVGTSRELPT